MNKIFRIVWNRSIGQWTVVSELASAPAGGTGSLKTRLVQPRTLLFGALALLLSAQAAAADIVNVGFETGTLDGWVTGNSGNQASGSYSGAGVGASVVTGMTDYASNQGPYSWTVLPYQSYMASLQAGNGSSTFTNAAIALGLDAGSRTSVASTMAGTPTNAAWMYQDLTLSAGSSFTMAWQYVSTDYVPYNDASLTSLVNLDDANVYATINNQAAQYALLGATTPGTGSYSTGSYGATGWQVATYQIADAGTYRLGFMSINLGDTSWSPVLFVDQQPGLTFNFGTPFGPVAPNPGSGAPVTPPPASGPVVIDDVTGTGGLGGATEASFEGGTLVVDNDGDTVSQDFVVDDAGGTIDQNGHTSLFSGTIADATSGQPGSLVIENSGNGGSTTFTGTNTYTGDTTIQSGATLALSGSGSISDSSKVTAEGIFDIAGADAAVDIKSLAGGGQVVLGGNELVLTNSNDTFAGTISGSGGVSLGGGTQVLSGENTYTGGTTLNGGTLQIDADTNLGDASGGLTFDGGTLKTTGDVDSARDVALAGDGRFDTATGTTLTSSGDISGTGGLIKDGEGGLVLTGTLAHGGGTVVNDGTLVLSGQNTYTGGTTLNGGTLQIDADTNLGDASGGLTFDGGTLKTTGNVDSARDVALAGDGRFDTATGTTLTSSGDISGTGGLIKDGEGGLVLTGTLAHGGGTVVNDGTLVLSGQNTYTGGTTLNGGTLQIDADANLGDASGGLTFDGGTLKTTGDVDSARDVALAGDGRFDTATGTTLTSSGDISGTGGLIKDGKGGLVLTGTLAHGGGTVVNDGTLVLSGENTYTGGTTLNGGTLQIDADANLGDASGGLTFDGGGLYVSGDVTTNRDIVLNGAGVLGSADGASLVLGGTVTGAGPLAYRGAGTLVLAGDNSHGGGTLVEGGSLRVDHVRGLGTGALTLDGARFQNGLDLTLAQTLVVRGQSIADIARGTTTTLAGAVDGAAADGCFIKSGLGRLQMTGNAVIAAGTCVTEGTLGVNGVLESRVQVDRAGTLRGTGAVKGTINVDGTLAAGNSPGTLLVEGAITMGAGSTLQVDIDGYGLGDGAGNYSRVVLVGSGSIFSASGTLQPVLRGITGDANNTFVPVVGDMFRIVSGQGGVTGRFDRLVQPTSGLAAGTRFQLHYITGFDIDLYVTPSSYEGFLDASATGNTRQVAEALDRLVEAGDAAPLDAQRTELLRSVWSLDSAGLGTALAGMSGERHAQLGATAFHAGAALASAVTDRLADVALDNSATTASRNLWVMASHGESSVDEDSRARGFESRHERLSAGVDLYRSDRGLFGVGVSRSESRLGGVAGLGEIDSNGVMVYGTARVNRALVDAMVSASSEDWRTRRPDALGTTSLEGETSGHGYVASLVARLPLTSTRLRWEPYVRAVWQNADYDAFHETGDALTALSIERYDESGSRISAGVRIGSLALDPLVARFTYRAGFAAGAQYGEFRAVTTAHRLGGEFLQAGSPDEGRAFVSFDLGGTWRVSERAYLFGDVDVETSRNRNGHTVNAGIRIAL